MKKELTIFDKPRNVRILLVCFYISLGVLLIADFFIHKHAAFGWEAYPDFFAAYGFISCVLLIYIAKLLRRLIKRSEDYYRDGQ
ncbi:MAG: hypothetical protein K9K81_12150 [Desulfobacteraceae bacterium]|nr:hypothetical protein [Desulfobacteraceae bacterium]